MRMTRWDLAFLACWGTGAALAAGPAVPVIPAADTPAAPPAASSWSDCVAHQPPLSCADAREPAALALAGEQRAKREGDTLTLQLFGPGEQALVLIDQPATPRAASSTAVSAGGLRYRLLGPLEHADAWLVAQVAAGDDTRAPRLRLFSAGNPAGLLLADWPWVAPNGRLIVVVDSPESGHAPGSVTLLQKAGARWSQVFRYEPAASTHLYFRNWRADSAALRLDWQRSGPNCAGAAQGTLQLRDGPYGWDFVPEPPAACANNPVDRN
ncbi:MAG TPA: hypothetical protein VLA61_15955 [Ideonella sp.]|uniref:hypothetical protein n=1 Tax=Ideonella sp. TaxID=1929293 RepID=UPI002CD23C45|nr:hypothetical protein [Ideonella sp.]HSI49765.1 hypothetical protein [Ideonella sp.]